MYHDSHAHLQLGNNSDEKLKNYENMYRKNLIGQMICNSTSENDFKEIEILSNQFKNRIIPCAFNVNCDSYWGGHGICTIPF